MSTPAAIANEQLDDECQLWSRAIRQLSCRQPPPPTLPLPGHGASAADHRVTWTARGVCLPLQLSRAVRAALLHLADETDHQRALIERLTDSERHTNADLRYCQEKLQLYREKLQQQGSESARSSGFPDTSSAASDSIQTLLLTSERERELLNTKQVAGSRAKALEAKVESQEAEIQRLRQKLLNEERAEADRQQRQMELFRSLKNRKPSRRCPMDNKMLDIIDNYEAQLQRLRLQLRESGAADHQDHHQSESQLEDPMESAAPGKGYRATIEQLNRQVAGLTDQVQCLENERELLCTELDCRPTTSDHVLLVSKLHRCERLLRKHNISMEQGAAGAGPKEFSSRVEDLDLLPLSVCQKHLKDTVKQLELQDLKQLRQTLEGLVTASAAHETARPAMAKVEQLLAVTDANRQELVPTLQSWRNQLMSVPELMNSLERLRSRLCPWAPQLGSGTGSTVQEAISFADRLAGSCDDAATEPSAASAGVESLPAPPYAALLGMMEHFRQLFDVANWSGVCTKMTSVYSELGVCRNSMNSIKEALGLVEHTPMEAVVSAVSRLMQLERLAVNDKLREIFSHDDVQLALDRMDEYDQFFPVFEQLMNSLMTVLGVSRVDDILPRVTAHKRVFDAQSGGRQ